MSRSKSIGNNNIFVHASRKFSSNEESEYLYCVSYQGNFDMEDLTSEDVRELIACLQHALDVNEKGDQP